MERERPTRDERKTRQIEPSTSLDQEKSMDLRPKLFVDACSLAQQGHYEKAKTVFLCVEPDCQEYSRAQYLLGCACNKLDEYNEYEHAVVAFDQAIQSFKANKQIIPVDLFYQKGFGYWKLGAYEDAIKS